MSPSEPTPTARRAGGPPPTEAPECESSTCHAISTPETVELHTAWPGWIPLTLIIATALVLAAFAVGRIAGW
ncbi:DUF6480 family protein [Kitasatospora sp. NPDC101801]|uniref:DUF6480 family protein n=1 Tax=Kitasatospora sp. NPDC101801 TaxID=3364103 RepID=UPI00382B3FDB